jgi:hypothetical protein
MDGYVANKRDTTFAEAARGGLKLVSVPVKSYYRRTFIKEALHDRQADSLRCSSYDDALSGKPRHVLLQRR